jgi:hypothetical protein
MKEALLLIDLQATDLMLIRGGGSELKDLVCSNIYR